MVATSLLVTIVWALSTFRATSDVEIWNGVITDKAKVYVSCSHSYDCFCYTTCSGSGENETCTEYCQTCYDHDNDWDWRVKSTVKNFNISRIDSRGSNEPPRWTDVIVGESASSTNSYTNYIKAAPDSLFGSIKSMSSEFDDIIPVYPAVYDYYRINRVLNVSGVSSEYSTRLNTLLSTELELLGPAKEVNIIVVFTDVPNSSYKYALERSWMGGKKNDVIVVIGTVTPPAIDWVETITLGLNSGNEMLGVVLHDEIMKLELDDPSKLAYSITQNVGEHFSRKPMKDFEYLKDDIQPATWVLVLAMILSLLSNIGLTIYFKLEDF